MDDWDLEAPQPKKGDPPGDVSLGESSKSEDGGTAEREPVMSAAGAVGERANVAAAAARPAGQAIARTRRSRVRRFLPMILGALALLLVGALVGYFIAQSQSAAGEEELAEMTEQLDAVRTGLAASEARNWNYYQENQALETEIADLRSGQGGPPPSSATSTTAPGEPAIFADGIYVVGEDISAGDYDGAITGQVGYWARLRGTSGEIGAIVANGLETGPFVLTINTSDVAVELRGVKLTAR